MQIKNTKAGLVVLIEYDQLPIGQLSSGTTIQSLATKYGFQSGNLLEASSGNRVAFTNGNSLKKGTHIELLEIQPRRFLLQVTGTSEDAEAFYSEIIEDIVALGNVSLEKLNSPILKWHDSTIYCYLDFEGSALISKDYYEFIQTNATDTFSSELVEAEIIPLNIEFRVQFKDKSEKLSKYKISLSNKNFSISPRAGFPLEDKSYVSQAPVDTKTHISLLEWLEKKIMDRPQAKE